MPLPLLKGAFIGAKKIGAAITGKGAVAKGAAVGLGGYGAGVGIREATVGAGRGARKFFLAGGEAVEQTGRAVERNMTGLVILAIIIGAVLITLRLAPRR